MTPTETIRLFLVDDHAMFREGVARMLESEAGFEVSGQAESATEALKRIPSSGANFVLLDVALGGERALDFVQRARDIGFTGRILVLTAGMSDQEAVQLVQAGVGGILHKHHSTEVLCGAVRQVARGEAWLEKAYLGPLFRTVDRTRHPKRPLLTERDKTVMRCLLQGLTNREIGAKLDISEGAAKASLRHVCEKLGVRTRTQLVKVALEQFKDQL
ncbi:MAG: response regulator transcription factor [Acidobacteriota bacterium]|nr:response regulator transcription factor [Acidobacteriota bacterium]